jgi:hypothetical protein
VFPQEMFLVIAIAVLIVRWDVRADEWIHFLRSCYMILLPRCLLSAFVLSDECHIYLLCFLIGCNSASCIARKLSNGVVLSLFFCACLYKNFGGDFRLCSLFRFYWQFYK